MPKQRFEITIPIIGSARCYITAEDADAAITEAVDRLNDNLSPGDRAFLDRCHDAGLDVSAIIVSATRLISDDPDAFFSTRAKVLSQKEEDDYSWLSEERLTVFRVNLGIPSVGRRVAIEYNGKWIPATRVNSLSCFALDNGEEVFPIARWAPLPEHPDNYRK